MRTVWIAGAVVAAAGLGWALWPAGGDGAASVTASGEMVAVTLPVLDATEAAGQAAFTTRCAACHGPNAGGLDGAGPPLIHKIYEPGHHGDIAFLYAATRGVRAHHWSFGDMPPVEGITEAEVAAILAFVRRVQQENGIF